MTHKDLIFTRQRSSVLNIMKERVNELEKNEKMKQMKSFRYML